MNTLDRRGKKVIDPSKDGCTKENYFHKTNRERDEQENKKNHNARARRGNQIEMRIGGSTSDEKASSSKDPPNIHRNPSTKHAKGNDQAESEAKSTGQDPESYQENSTSSSDIISETLENLSEPPKDVTQSKPMRNKELQNLIDYPITRSQVIDVTSEDPAIIIKGMFDDKLKDAPLHIQRQSGTLIQKRTDNDNT